MQEERFYIWLNTKFTGGTARSRLSNCKRIEQFEGDLDSHFSNDKGASLLHKLSYTKDDKRNNRKSKHKIPIDGNISTGTATLKQAAKLYFKFKSGEKPTENKCNRSSILVRRKKQYWPEWSQPSDEELFELIKLTAKYIKFLSPDIVHEIVKDNLAHLSQWVERLEAKGIPSQIYLWDMSPCAFPGVRRYSGSKEIAFFRNHTELPEDDIKYAVKLDDNDYPKQIWSFILRGSKFQKYGPKNYALAHLADHKEFNNRLFSEFDVGNNIKQHELFGLFTCPTNTAYIPAILLRPTDFSAVIRRLLIRKVHSLYGDFCNILPPWLNLKSKDKQLWNCHDFKWSEPVGDRSNVEIFLKYRLEIMNSILK